jgi:hypothetical protein
LKSPIKKIFLILLNILFFQWVRRFQFKKLKY